MPGRERLHLAFKGGGEDRGIMDQVTGIDKETPLGDLLACYEGTGDPRVTCVCVNRISSLQYGVQSD